MSNKKLYAGHQTEKLISQYVNQINQVYQQSYPGVELELKKFDSNFFDAKAQYAIKVNIRKLTANLAKLSGSDTEALNATNRGVRFDVKF
jgi:primosomal protein N''